MDKGVHVATAPGPKPVLAVSLNGPEPVLAAALGPGIVLTPNLTLK